MASPGRSGQGGLSLQTVVVASLASVTAAILTSRLLPPGATIVTAAMTPVIVALVSDLLHRPARRVTEIRARRTTAVREPARMGGPLEEGRLAPIEEGLDSLRADPAPPSHNGASSRSDYGRRRIHPKWIAVTAGIAFVLAVGALTIPELLFGGALGSDKRTTVFGGSDTPAQKDEPAPEEEAPAEEPVEEAPPVQMEPEDDPEAQPQPTETETAPEPAPEETQPEPAPADPPAPVPEVP